MTGSDAPKATPSRRVRATDTRLSTIPVTVVGRKLAPHEDFYHWVLTLSWSAFFGAVAAAFFVLNVLFAIAYSLQPGCIANAGGFADHFFFSVQTLGTIGYGGMAPATRFGNVVVSVEALVGILTTALITGLTFARFARPTAKVLFSEKIVVAPHNGVPHMMFRLANWRRNQVVEAKLHVLVLLTEVTREGETFRRPTPLTLVRDSNPMFALSWTAFHRIDESSPFYGPNAMAKLRAQRAELYLSMSGLDETIMQTIHARWRYHLDDIVFDARFVDILGMRDDGVRFIDFDKFHDIEAIAAPVDGRPAPDKEIG